MISHTYKCIFVAVPKTASSSIRRILGQPPQFHLNICQIRYNLQYHWTHYGGIGNRLMASLYLLLPVQKRIDRGNTLFDSYFKFGFVRNPWDRVVSLYLRREGAQMAGTTSFEEFVSWIRYSSSTSIHPVPHVNQLDWFVDPSGNLLVDFIGKFENLSDDWSYVSKQLGLDHPLPHVKKNPKRKKHYTAFYTGETKRIIGEKFKTDIEYFGYDF